MEEQTRGYRTTSGGYTGTRRAQVWLVDQPKKRQKTGNTVSAGQFITGVFVPIVSRLLTVVIGKKTYSALSDQTFAGYLSNWIVLVITDCIKVSSCKEDDVVAITEKFMCSH